MYPRSPVETHAIGRTAAATVAWRHRGRLRLSVVVKATFAFVVDGPMAVTAVEPLHATELHHEGDPARSLRAASDLAPYRTHADVVLTGHAPVPEESATVRLAVYRDRALIDKSFDVVPSGDLEGSHTVPLVYEQSPGGPEFDDNPVGTSLPSIVDSSDPQRPVGFGPIAATWPARARRLGGFDPRALQAAIPSLPDDLDWSYYSAAPVDQVMDYLHGDEWIVLENLVDGCPMVRMQLPTTHAEARILGLGPAPIVKMLADALHLDLDRGVASITWRGSFEIPSEESMRGVSVMVGVATQGQPIAWPALPPRREPVVVPAPPMSARPVKPVVPPAPPSSGRSAPPIIIPAPPGPKIGVRFASPIVIPAPPASARSAPPIILPAPPTSARPVLPIIPAPPASARVATPPVDLDPPSSRYESTMEIGDEPTSPPALPFAPVAPRLPPPMPPPSRPAVADYPFESTMTMSGDEANAALARLAVLPFAPPPQARPAIFASPIHEASYSLEEAAIFDDEPEETTVPMAKALRRARPDARPSQGIPGAPWSDVPATPVPRPSAELDETTRAIRRDEMLARLGVMTPAAAPAPAPSPLAPAPAPSSPALPALAQTPPPEPEAPKGEPAPSWSWVSVADAPKVDLNPPRPPRPPPTPAVQNALYNRFTAKKK